MWCPSVSLSVWANAWLAGVAAPDDVLDSLSQWAPRHSVTAYDSVAAGRTGLPWPDLTDAGAVSLLQTLRTSAGPWRSAPPMGVALPVPGDVRGLPAGTQFQRDAVTAGEALILTGDAGEAIGLVPDFEYPDVGEDRRRFRTEPDPCALSWTVYSVPGATPAEDSTSVRRSTHCVLRSVRPPTPWALYMPRWRRGDRGPAKTRRTGDGIRAAAPCSGPCADRALRVSRMRRTSTRSSR